MAIDKRFAGWLISLLLITSAASGTTYYVATGGNDAWDGLAAEWDGVHGPKATIQAAIDGAAIRNTVQVAAGTYSGNIHFNGNDIILTSANPSDWSAVEGTVIQGDGTTAAVTFSGMETSACAIQGFTIRGGNNANPGGGIAGNGTLATISHCSVNNNYSEDDGAGIYGCDGKIDRCIIRQNESEERGSGLANCQGDIINCLITGNYSWDVGAVAFCNGRILNCTLADNESDKFMGGLYNCQGMIINCIVWGNGLGQTLDCSELQFCCVQGGAPGTGNNSHNPQFVGVGDYHLQSGSPCIDAGTNHPVGGLPEQDLDNLPRPANGNADEIVTADMGAYEFPSVNQAVLYLDVSALTYSGLEGADSGLQKTLRIRNTGTLPLQWHLAETCSWLEIPVSSDTLEGGVIANAAVHVNLSGLAPGDYSCTLTVSSEEAINSPLEVSVQLHVARQRLVPGEYGTIQNAIDAAADGDAVLVSPGTYKENINFNGKAILVRSVDPSNWSAVESTIIDGQYLRSCVVFDHGEEAESVLDGFTLTNGRGSSVWIEYLPGQTYFSTSGAGILCKNSSPTIRRCNIRGNGFDRYNVCQYTVNEGGGIALIGAVQARISNCFIVENVCQTYGGGIFICGATADEAAPIIEFCTIANNRVTSTQYTSFEVDSVQAKPTLTNTIIDAVSKNECALLMGDFSQVRYCCISNAKKLPAGVSWWTRTTVQDYAFSPSSEIITKLPGFVQCRNEYTCSTLTRVLPSDLTPGDYHLRVDSPCLNAGDPGFTDLNAPDIDGESRVMGGRADIGADEIAPTITLRSPQTGDVWAAGSSHFIRWDSVGYEDAVNLFYSTDHGASWTSMAAGAANTGDYEWTAPSGVESAECLVKIEAANPPAWIQYRAMDGLFAIHTSVAGAEVSSVWPTLGGSGRRTGLSGLAGPELGCVAWEYEAPARLAGGVVFGAAGHLHLSGEDGTIYTLDASGNLVWSYATGGELSTAPAVGHDGTVYAGNANGTLFAVDKDGQLRWTHTMEGAMLGSVAVGADHQVYAATLGGTVYALAEDGSEIWTFTVEPNGRLAGMIVAPLTLAQDGSVLAGCGTQPILYALNPANGSVRWKQDFSTPVNPNGSWVKSGFAAAPVVGPDGTIYVSMIKNTYLYALNPANGSIQWSADLGDPSSGRFDSLYQRYFYRSAWTEPAVGPDGTIYVSFGVGDGYLRAVNPNGSIRWVTRLGRVGEFTLTVDKDGLIYAAGEDGAMYAVDSEGRMVSRFDGADSLSYPVPGEGKIVYIIDDAKKLYAIQREGCPSGSRPFHRIFDPNGDGMVNTADLLILRSQWMKNTSPYDAAIWPVKAEWSAGYVRDVMYLQGDFNRDLIVDLKDLEMIRDHWLLSE